MKFNEIDVLFPTTFFIKKIFAGHEWYDFPYKNVGFIAICASGLKPARFEM